MTKSRHKTDDQNIPRRRVLVTKIGLDGHDRGSRIVASYLRDAGMEVIYTSPWQTIETVVKITLQEDIDVIGLGSLATDHLIIPDLMNALKKAELAHVRVVVGGIVPKTEIPLLLDAGVSEVFGPGALKEEIIISVEALAKEADAAKSKM